MTEQQPTKAAMRLAERIVVSRAPILIPPEKLERVERALRHDIVRVAFLLDAAGLRQAVEALEQIEGSVVMDGIQLPQRANDIAHDALAHLNTGAQSDEQGKCKRCGYPIYPSEVTCRECECEQDTH